MKKKIIQDHHLLKIDGASRETTGKVVVLSWQKKKGRGFHALVASFYI